MALTDDHIGKIAQLIKPLRQEISDLRTEMNAQFTEIQNNFEGLYARDENRQQEYLVLRGQIARPEERVDAIEKKVA